MKKHSWIFSLFFILAIIQVIPPASMIFRWEKTLSTGVEFKFKAAQIDLSSSLGGRFISLQLEAEKVPRPSTLVLHRNQNVYATIITDENGFARVGSLMTNSPAGGSYVRAKVREVRGRQIILELPFHSYYLEEERVPNAEEAFGKKHASEKYDGYVTVRVRAGDAVLEELYIDGIPVKEFIRGQKTDKKLQ